MGSAKMQLKFEILQRAEPRRTSRFRPMTSSRARTVTDPVLPTAGQITRTSNPSRQLQFSVKVTF